MPTSTLPNALQDFLDECTDDPLRFVLGAFPWGKAGTLLAGEPGPDGWQAEVLDAIGAHVRGSEGALRLAVASGHGVGKTALTSFITLWYLAVHPHPQVVVTANTSQQLTTKTWRELAKWLRLSSLDSTFQWTATRCYHKGFAGTWFAAAVPWSADRPEAFAGTHEKHVLVLFDEASRVDDAIWETTEGAMTTPGALWLAFGNPTRNTGRFKECFAGGRFAHRWQTYQVDSRTARKADQEQIRQWITDYGDDSDFVRVRVKGTFPRQAVGQFISDEVIKEAQQRTPVDDPLQPVVMGVDVARFGDDASVIIVRQGNRILTKQRYQGMDTARLTGYLCELIDHYRSHKPTVFIDGVGLGAGVIDQCRARGYPVVEVLANERPQDPEHYYDKTAEMWDRMRRWLEERAALDPKERQLAAELTGREYDYTTGKLRMEKKADMKSRGLSSPDEADSLSLSFAHAVALKTMPVKPLNGRPRVAGAQGWMGR